MPTIAPNTPERKAPNAWAIFLAVLALPLAFTYLAIATGPLLAQGAQTQTGAGPQIVILDPFTANLNDGTGHTVQVSLGLEVGDRGAADELKKVLPNIADSVLKLLSSQNTESILTLDGKERLRSQILREANAFMTAHKINRVVYYKFFVQ